MALSFSSLTKGDNFGDSPSTSKATASITPTANRLIVADIITADFFAHDPRPPSSVAGAGLTFTKIGEVTYNLGDNVYVTQWRAMSATPSTGAITITCPVNQDNFIWSIYESSADVDTTGVNGAGAIVQTVTNSGSGTSLSVTLAAFGSTNNAAIAGFGAAGGGTFTLGSGFTLLNNQGDVLFSEYKLNDNTVDASYSTSGNWAGVASEVRAATIKKLAALGVG